MTAPVKLAQILREHGVDSLSPAPHRTHEAAAPPSSPSGTPHSSPRMLRRFESSPAAISTPARPALGSLRVSASPKSPRVPSAASVVGAALSEPLLQVHRRLMHDGMTSEAARQAIVQTVFDILAAPHPAARGSI